MTLDEAIRHCEETAERCPDECGAEHRQMAEWLTELQDRRDAEPGHLTDEDLETIRIHLSAFKGELCNQGRWEEAREYERIIMRLKAFASAQQWIRCSKKLPENEQDILVTVEVRPLGRIPYRRVVRAFYTDGKHTDADSAYFWDDLPNPQYDDKGNLIIPEGWWESSDYYEQQGMIDDFVIAWTPLQESYKGNNNG